MADLYTSLTALKQEMQTGQPVPFVPVIGDATRFIDPDFVPGMGALEEHPEKGLRCPVRGCGQFFHDLSNHLRHTHKAIGAQSVRSALDLANAPLVSRAVSARKSEAMLRRRAAGFTHTPQRTTKADRMGWKGRPGLRRSALSLNFIDSCQAQLNVKLQRLSMDLGTPSPSMVQARKHLGKTFVTRCCRVFGSWEAAKKHAGLRSGNTKKWSQEAWAQDAVIDIALEWHKVHGRWPSACDAQRPDRTPLLPCYETMLKVFGASKWSEVVAYLNWMAPNGVMAPEEETA